MPNAELRMVARVTGLSQDADTVQTEQDRFATDYVIAPTTAEHGA